jgi:hypothetical protein
VPNLCQQRQQSRKHFSAPPSFLPQEDLGYEHLHPDIFGSYTRPERSTVSTQKEKKPVNVDTLIEIEIKISFY